MNDHHYTKLNMCTMRVFKTHKIYTFVLTNYSTIMLLLFCRNRLRRRDL